MLKFSFFAFKLLFIFLYWSFLSIFIQYSFDDKFFLSVEKICNASKFNIFLKAFPVNNKIKLFHFSNKKQSENNFLVQIQFKFKNTFYKNMKWENRRENVWQRKIKNQFMFLFVYKYVKSLKHSFINTRYKFVQHINFHIL